MTTRDEIVKWLTYGLALLPIWLLDSFLFSRFTVFGVHPMLLPLAAVAVAVLEGAAAGAGFGAAVGLLWDAMIPGVPGAMILVLALVGLGAGLLAQYALRQDLLGDLVCSALTLLLIDAGRICLGLLTRRAPLGDMLSVALREIGWTLCFVPAVFLLLRRVSRHVPRPTVF